MTKDSSIENRVRWFSQGADEMIQKPYTLNDMIKAEALVERFEATFWGARGTLPVSGEGALKYGGNTSCVAVDIGADRHFIFDAGTGLKKYSKYLMEKTGGKFDGYIFISHPHWDHLNCLPFFTPVYIPGNRISLMGPPQDNRSFRDLLDGQMDGTYFPITVDAFGADVQYGDMREGQHYFEGVSLRAFHLKHPGYCLGYRMDHAGSSLAYITDNELGNIDIDDDFIERLAEFLHGVDFLIHDATYFDHEYGAKVSWGHSCVAQVVALAHKAQAKKLFLFHHDPDHSDEDLEIKLGEALNVMAELGATFECFIASEGDTWDVGQGRRIV
ncbi:MAG: MBL fold metallo-hydrolase [Methylococcus sp.]